MKGSYHNIFNKFFMALLAISISHMLVVKYRQSTHLAYWAKSGDNQLIDFNNRAPSSRAEFNQDIIDNLKPYFDYSTFKKYVNYDLSLKFRSNVDELKAEKQWRPLFHRSLEKTLTPKSDTANNLESIFLTAFNDDLLHDFTTQFLAQLKLKEIKAGKFQVDILFKPKLSPHFSFNQEVTSNKLVNWGQTNQFREDVVRQAKEESSSLTQHILDTQLPNTSTDYQYKGGIISFWFELEEGDKASGFVRFRKYYTAPHIKNLRPFIKEKDFRLSMIHFKKSQSASNELYVTSDFYQSYSLENPKPKAERLELHFGKLLPNNLSYSNLGSRQIASLSSKPFQLKEERVLDLGNLNLHGVSTYEGKQHLFTSTIESLVFDFHQGEFSQKSKIKTVFKDSKLKGHRKGSLKHKVSEKIIKEHGLSLIQRFKLGSLHPRFKGSKGKLR